MLKYGWIYISCVLFLQLCTPRVYAFEFADEYRSNISRIAPYISDFETLEAKGSWQALEIKAGQAIKDLEDPKNPGTNFQVGRVYAWLGEALEAQHKYPQAMQAYGTGRSRFVINRIENLQYLQQEETVVDNELLFAEKVVNEKYNRHDLSEPLYRRKLAIGELSSEIVSPEYRALLPLEKMANHFKNAGRLVEAEEYARWHIRAAAQQNSGDVSGRKILALVLDRQGRYAESAAVHEELVLLEEKSFQEYGARPSEYFVAREWLAKAYIGLAKAYRKIQKNAEADQYFQKAMNSAMDMFTSNTAPPSATGRVFTSTRLFHLAEVGDLFLEAGDYANAEKMYRVALSVVDEGASSYRQDAFQIESLRKIEEKIATTMEKRGDYIGALGMIRNACEYEARKVFDTRVTAGDYDLPCASNVVKYSWRAKRELRGEAGGASNDALMREAFLAAQISRVSEASIALSRATGRKYAEAAGQATLVADFDRAVIALRDVDQTGFNLVTSKGFASEEVKLMTKNYYANNLGKKYGYNRAKDNLYNAGLSDYFEYRNLRPVSVGRLQSRSGVDAKLLRENEAIVVWVSPSNENITDRGMVFAVSKDGAAWAQIGMSADEISRDVAKLRNELDSVDSYSQQNFDRRVSRRLYKALLGDVAIQSVIGAKSIDTLIFVPSKETSALPPSVLVSEDPVGDDAVPDDVQRTKWLIRDKAIAVIPSVSALEKLRLVPISNGTEGKGKVVAFVNPDFRGRFRSLDSTIGDGEALAAVSPDRNAIFYTTQATEVNLRRLDGDATLLNAPILGFATHGLNAVFPGGVEEPALALATPDVAVDNLDDGLLSMTEVLALKLSADWVVLSACNTGGGMNADGEAMGGMARAFFYAGAKGVLVSHWRVNDSATSDLIKRTFFHYGGGRISGSHTSKAQSLRLAMLDLIDDPDLINVEPKYWAPFVLVGQPD